jgi:dsDNA-specific endonuclease/ATPase MutS2
MSEEDEFTLVPITEEIDLHSFSPRDIPSLVDEYLREARLRGFTVVRLVHGRGKGVQRAVVRQILASHPGVLSFDDAPEVAGGWGATLAKLAPLDRAPESFKK